LLDTAQLASQRPEDQLYGRLEVNAWLDTPEHNRLVRHWRHQPLERERFQLPELWNA
jgi:hypothetical protein